MTPDQLMAVLLTIADLRLTIARQAQEIDQLRALLEDGQREAAVTDLKDRVAK